MRVKLIVLTLCAGIFLGITGVLIWEEWSEASLRSTDLYNQTALAAHAQTYLLPASQTNYLPIRDYSVSDPDLEARAALLADGESGKILYALNADQKLPIASLTKLMSALIVLDTFDLDDVFAVSAEDLNIAGLGADLQKGERISGSELFKLMLIKSSNDAVSVFATAAERGNIDFVELMNARAQRLGMHSTFFNDPAGLDDAATYSTASDLLKLVKEVDRYPIIWQTLLVPEADIVSSGGLVRRHVTNTDKLLGVIPDVRGGKTGNTSGALGTLIIIAGARNNTPHALISIILGSRDRFSETKTLVDWGKKAHSWPQ